MVIQSQHGGHYYFIRDDRVTSKALPNDIWGHIYCIGKVYDIIKDKMHQNHLITDWLSKGYKQQHIMYQYTNMCENYARHITITHPEPGTWWTWKE